MKNLVTKEVSFNGATLMAAQTEDGKIHVGVKWICQGMGLTKGQMQAERGRIQEDLVLSQGERKIVLPTRGGKQEVLCLELRFLPLWLAKINANIIDDPAVQEKLVDYQLNAADVLAKAFIGDREMPKNNKQRGERLASVNNAVKILMPILQQAGCGSKIQLLTAKSLYEKSGVLLPIEIEADKKYYDTKYIARQCGMFTKSNKPAYQAANMIIKKLDIHEDQYTDTWETNGSWQGTVRKYDESVLMVMKEWLTKHDHPEYIEYTQYDGQTKRYRVLYKPLGKEVA